ncbi:hypothetical protein ACFP2T_36095 [Plantactinospora solaniradicis]|uniref:Lipoprotein n=1 Tax=Plantactinospora solaniradicis TaxID=1723736 RepID=A0ABW1KKQ4_9ACTN
MNGIGFKTSSNGRVRLGAIGAAMLAVLAFGAAGCGGDGDEPSKTVASAPAAEGGPTASAAADGRGDPTAYAQCMRTNGIPNFPDPADGRAQLPREIDPNSPTFRDAHEKCKQYAGNTQGGGGPQQDTWPVAEKLKYAQCMRQNGLPGFPDPDESGRMEFDPTKIDPKSTAFKNAEKACADFQPENARPNNNGGGGPGPAGGGS